MVKVHPKLELKKRPTIIFVNGRLPLPLSVGGDGVSMNIILKNLHELGYPVISIGSTNPKKQPMGITQMKEEILKHEIKSEIVHTKNRLEYHCPYTSIAVAPSKILSEIESLTSKANNVIVFTQLEMSPEISDWAISKNIPLVFFVHDAEPENLWTLDILLKAPNKSWVIFNSNYTKDKFTRYAKTLKTSVIYPPIESNRRLKRTNRKFVTMINPVKVKGGKTFFEIAKNLPNIKFLGIKVWYDPLKDGLDFSKLNNVKIWEKQVNIDSFLEKTKLLLVPSIWEEGFGRIVIESMSKGVPVVASKIGGLVEAIGDSGILIENYKNPNDWIKEICFLLKSPATLRLYSKKGIEHSSKFRISNCSNKIEEIINNLLKN